MSGSVLIPDLRKLDHDRTSTLGDVADRWSSGQPHAWLTPQYALRALHDGPELFFTGNRLPSHIEHDLGCGLHKVLDRSDYQSVIVPRESHSETSTVTLDRCPSTTFEACRVGES